MPIKQCAPDNKCYPPHLLQQLIRVKIINIQQIGPPVLIARGAYLHPSPKRPIAKKCQQIGVKQDDEHVTWGQPVKQKELTG